MTSVSCAGVTIENISKIYEGTADQDNVKALAEVSLDIAPGEFVSVLGPSGCGKSTLLRCVAGLETPSTGTIRVGSTPVHLPPNKLGMVFQRDALLDWRSVLANVMLPVDFRHGRWDDYLPRAHELLKTFGLTEFSKSFPSQLSGGMRQRVSICRALIDDPELLLMDEPFGALDALTREQLNIELQSMWLKSRKTVMFVTHSIAEAIFLADRVVVFTPRPGSIAAVLNIEAPRPRKLEMRGSSQFTEYVDKIRDLFADMGLLRENP